MVETPSNISKIIFLYISNYQLFGFDILKFKKYIYKYTANKHNNLGWKVSKKNIFI